jgi:hypothetical protein
MHSLSSLAIVMLATLTLTVAAGAFAVWLFWLLTSVWQGDVDHFTDRPCLRLHLAPAGFAQSTPDRLTSGPKPLRCGNRNSPGLARVISRHTQRMAGTRVDS